jgi:hypothetical protein
MLVPLIVLYRVGLGQEEKTSRPGPAISIFPRQENDDGVRFESSEATDMMVGEFAGAIVGPGPELPAAAMIRQPLASAASPAAVYAGCGPPGPPRDMLITVQRLAIAQAMPASIPAMLPEPELLSTLPTNI